MLPDQLEQLAALEKAATPGKLESVGVTRLWITGEGGGAVALIAEPECKNSSKIHELDLGSKRWKEGCANAAKIEAFWNAAPELIAVVRAALNIRAELDLLARTYGPSIWTTGAGHWLRSRYLEIEATTTALSAVLPVAADKVGG